MTVSVEKDIVVKLNTPDYRGCNTCRFYSATEHYDIVFCNNLMEPIGLQTQCPYYAESDISKTRNDPVVFDS